MHKELGRRDLFESAAGLGAGVALAGLLTEAPHHANAAPVDPYFDQAVADEIIAHANALEAAEARKDPDLYASLLPEDYTEISPHFPMILKGRDTAKRIQEFAKAAPQTIACNFINHPKVNVFGDLAVLLYISVRIVRDGEGRTDAACRRVTRVYAKENATDARPKWSLAHSHFSSFDYKSNY